MSDKTFVQRANFFDIDKDFVELAADLKNQLDAQLDCRNFKVLKIIDCPRINNGSV